MKNIKSFEKYNENVLTDGFTPENARYNAGIKANKIIEQLRKLLLPIGKLTEQVVTRAIDSINSLNRIINDEIIEDDAMITQLKKSDSTNTIFTIIKNIEVNPNGINRSTNKYSATINSLWLGGKKYDLIVKPLSFWLDRAKKDRETENIISNQLCGWINSNINLTIDTLKTITHK